MGCPLRSQPRLRLPHAVHMCYPLDSVLVGKLAGTPAFWRIRQHLGLGKSRASCRRDGRSSLRAVLLPPAAAYRRVRVPSQRLPLPAAAAQGQSQQSRRPPSAQPKREPRAVKTEVKAAIRKNTRGSYAALGLRRPTVPDMTDPCTAQSTALAPACIGLAPRPDLGYLGSSHRPAEPGRAGAEGERHAGMRWEGAVQVRRA